jgi:hypothetical protein
LLEHVQGDEKPGNYKENEYGFRAVEIQCVKKPSGQDIGEGADAKVQAQAEMVQEYQQDRTTTKGIDAWITQDGWRHARVRHNQIAERRGYRYPRLSVTGRYYWAVVAAAGAEAAGAGADIEDIGAEDDIAGAVAAAAGAVSAAGVVGAVAAAAGGVDESSDLLQAVRARVISEAARIKRNEVIFMVGFPWWLNKRRHGVSGFCHQRPRLWHAFRACDRYSRCGR